MAVKLYRHPDGRAGVDEPPGERRSPVGTLFVDQRCTTEWDGTDVFLVSHFFRKPGQAAHDPRTGVRTEGQFESSARLEVFLQTPTQ